MFFFFFFSSVNLFSIITSPKEQSLEHFMVTQGERGSHSKKSSDRFIPCWLNEPHLEFFHYFSSNSFFQFKTDTVYFFSLSLLCAIGAGNAKTNWFGKALSLEWLFLAGREWTGALTEGYSTVTHTSLKQLKADNFWSFWIPLETLKEQGAFPALHCRKRGEFSVDVKILTGVSVPSSEVPCNDTWRWRFQPFIF